MNADLTTFKNNNSKKDIKWTKEQEELLAEWSEKATCYRWLHSRSEKLYRKRNYTFTIPVIILSTLTGTANFAMDSFVPEEYKQTAMATVGSVNIFAGILSTLQNFLRYAELMESHRQSEVLWSKFSRNIAIELTLEPKRRKHADDFLKTCRQEYDQLIESSPTIDDQIIAQFKKEFKNATLKKPDICNGLDECKIYKPSKEEKIENIVSNAGDKLLHIKNKPKWNNKPNKPNKPQSILKKEIDNTNNLKSNMNPQEELSTLSTIGKVSSFKEKLEKSDIENKINNENETPIESINKVVKMLSENIEEEKLLPDKSDEKVSCEKINDIIEDKKEEVLEEKKEEVLEEKKEEVLEDKKEEELLEDKVEEVLEEKIEEVLEEKIEEGVETVEDKENNSDEHVSIFIGDFDKS